jgi:hypothetical protein
MYMKTLLSLVALSGLLLNVGCSKPDIPPPPPPPPAFTVLTGQVFLQTNGGPQKFSAVRVYAFPTSTYAEPIMAGQPSMLSTPESAKYWAFLDAETARLNRELRSAALAKLNQQIEERGGQAIPTTSGEHEVVMPTQLASTVTDADGRFKLKVPGSEPFVVFAEVYRVMTREDSELDQWLIKSADIEDRDNFLLQNGNLTKVNGQAAPK